MDKIDENKTEFNIEHAKKLFQTLANIAGNKYGFKIEACVTKR